MQTYDPLVFSGDLVRTLNSISESDIEEAKAGLPETLCAILDSNKKIALLYVLVNNAYQKRDSRAFEALTAFFKKIINEYYGLNVHFNDI
ncbi:MAG: hypothetical protein H6779_03105 [Candidatus Nomurabacteria bacterium]|nr:MAG: hypothetical protein H6779_03105 [Candidatus Nomurabacteria bacterium]